MKHFTKSLFSFPFCGTLGVYCAEERHGEDVCHEVHEQTAVHWKRRGSQCVQRAGNPAGNRARVPGESLVSSSFPSAFWGCLPSDARRAPFSPSSWGLGCPWERPSEQLQWKSVITWNAFRKHSMEDIHMLWHQTFQNSLASLFPSKTFVCLLGVFHSLLATTAIRSLLRNPLPI